MLEILTVWNLKTNICFNVNPSGVHHKGEVWAVREISPLTEEINSPYGREILRSIRLDKTCSMEKADFSVISLFAYSESNFGVVGFRLSRLGWKYLPKSLDDVVLLCIFAKIYEDEYD